MSLTAVHCARTQHSPTAAQCTRTPQRRGQHALQAYSCCSSCCCGGTANDVTSSSQLCVDYFKARLAQLSLDSVYDIPRVNTAEATCSLHDDVIVLDLLNANDVPRSSDGVQQEHSVQTNDDVSASQHSDRHSRDVDVIGVDTCTSGLLQGTFVGAEPTYKTSLSPIALRPSPAADDGAAIATRRVDHDDDGCQVQPNEHDLNCNNNNSNTSRTCSSTCLSAGDDGDALRFCDYAIIESPVAFGVAVTHRPLSAAVVVSGKRPPSRSNSRCNLM